ncbi:TetR/AcrR family transcriptional regulator [uncultured Williamsia sp.]|uniref:TetR/AcrR family transcriptional regulator n=1 Tax=uncultured Williamsia sp. TaxID=259311 RepID=UPI0026337F16|nr:TetR/AcrR family transcriptional regulator [uncultured Williamsia sp.]
MSSTPTPRRGRPRDPDIESRVVDAVEAVYWSTGWAGFTVDAVARTAGVGREAIYRRWPTKIALLVGALERTTPLPGSIDTGSLRGDLIELACQLLSTYRSRSGMVAIRVALDARAFPDLLEPLTHTISRSRFTATRDIVRRGVGRGELPTDTDITLLLEMLTGAVLSHVLFAHDHGMESADDARYAGAVVDMALASVPTGAR